MNHILTSLTSSICTSHPPPPPLALSQVSIASPIKQRSDGGLGVTQVSNHVQRRVRGDAFRQNAATRDELVAHIVDNDSEMTRHFWKNVVHLSSERVVVGWLYVIVKYKYLLLLLFKCVNYYYYSLLWYCLLL